MQHCTSTLRRPLPPRPPSRWPGQPPPSPAGVALVHDSPGARDPQEESKSVAAVLAGLLDRPLSLPAPSGGVPGGLRASRGPRAREEHPFGTQKGAGEGFREDCLGREWVRVLQCCSVSFNISWFIRSHCLVYTGSRHQVRGIWAFFFLNIHSNRPINIIFFGIYIIIIFFPNNRE